MKKKLQNIIEDNRELLVKLKISIDEVKNSELDFVEKAEQVDLFSDRVFTRMILFESSRLYIQILNIETEKTMYFFDDVLDDTKDLNDIIIEAIKKM